jgi:hypothetical protein
MKYVHVLDVFVTTLGSPVITHMFITAQLQQGKDVLPCLLQREWQQSHDSVLSAEYKTVHKPYIADGRCWLHVPTADYVPALQVAVYKPM